MNPYLIIDFDSTLTTLESLDELANIALTNHPERATVMTELERITNLGMEGTIGFAESLSSRLKLFQADADHIEQLIALLRRNLTASALGNKAFFQARANHIYVISGGFADYIKPVIGDLGLLPEHVLANKFTFDKDSNIIGYDISSPLAHDNGKVEQLIQMQLPGPVYMIGDGYTDYQVKAQGQADKFYVFTENIRRDTVIKYADAELPSFDALAAMLSSD